MVRETRTSEGGYFDVKVGPGWMNNVLDIGGGKQETVQNKFPLKPFSLDPYSLHLSYWKEKKYVYSKLSQLSDV